MSLRDTLTRKRVPEEGQTAHCRYERQGDELIVACQQCEGKHDLTDRACLGGVIAALEDEGGVSQVLLSGDWDVVYGSGCAAVLRSLADIWCFCREAARPRHTSKECADCSSNPSLVFRAVSSSLLNDWQVGCKGSLPRARSVDARCGRCREETRRGLEQIAQLMGEVERQIARSCYRMAEATE
jgi:hypothetical protein